MLESALHNHPITKSKPNVCGVQKSYYGTAERLHGDGTEAGSETNNSKVSELPLASEYFQMGI